MDGKEEQVFESLEWLTAMYSHVSNNSDQMARFMNTIAMFLGVNAKRMIKAV